jgi:hypothetical protein
MWTQVEKKNNTNICVSKAFSLTIFLYLTKNFQEESEKLIPFLQQHHLTLERLKGKGHRRVRASVPVSYKNANFVASSHQHLSLKDCVLLSQFLFSKVTVLAFFYNGQMFSVSRLRYIQKTFLESVQEPKKNKYPFHLL